MVQSRRIRVLVIDDHETVRTGLQTLLEVFDDVELVAAVDSRTGLEMCLRLLPDVVLIEPHLSAADGLAFIRQITYSHPQIKVIIMSTWEDAEHVQEALSAGASAYLVKNVGIDEIANAIRTAARGC